MKLSQVLSDFRRVVPDYDPAQGDELAGFVRFQGWKEMEFTEREQLVLDTGISNFEFHYFGSAKNLGGIVRGSPRRRPDSQKLACERRIPDCAVQHSLKPL